MGIEPEFAVTGYLLLLESKNQLNTGLLIAHAKPIMFISVMNNMKFLDYVMLENIVAFIFAYGMGIDCSGMSYRPVSIKQL